MMELYLLFLRWNQKQILMKNYPIYVAGEMVSTLKELEVMNPFTGEIFAKTSMATDKEFEHAVAKAQLAADELQKMPSWKKSRILLQIAEGIEAQKQEIAETLACEAGKPITLALGELDRAKQTFVVAAEEVKRLPSEQLSLDWTPAGEGKEAWVKHFPVGLVAGIAPFNFPLNLATHKIAPAIAAGCPIVLKPASSTPLSTLMLAQIIDQTELPKGAVSIMPMDRTTGNRLVTDDRFSLLSFTGSPEVGWRMKADAGKKKVVLELGGNAGLIVSSSADVGRTIDRAVAGGFAYSGQVCIHTQRIFVHESLFDEFVDRYVEKVEQLRKGDPLDESTQVTAMIDEWNAKRVESWIKEAVAGGASLLCGGVREDAYLAPTILTNTQSDMKVCDCEVFGPVVVVERFSEFEEAVERVNDSRFGLQAGVFTDSLTEMNYAYSNLEVGGVIVNDVPTFRVDHMPYGGVKDSGLGREGIKYAIHDMLEPKILVKDC